MVSVSIMVPNAGGGVSYAVYAAGTATVTLDSQTEADLAAGTSGAGGTAPSGGNPGTQGQSGQKNF